MSALPEPWRDLVTELRKIKEQVRRLSNATPFFGTGVHPDGEGGLVVEGVLNVTSGEVKSGDYVPGSAGWHLAANAVPEFNDIILRDLPNSALANPLDPARLHDEADAFAVTGVGSTWNNILSVSVTVPTGFTRALVLNAVTAVNARNNTASPDFVYARCQANGTSLGGWILGSTTTAPGDYGITSQIQTGLLEGLVGGSTLTFTGQASVTYASWGTDASNTANLDVVLLWLR